MSFFEKNKGMVVLSIVLGLALLAAWKTNFTFSKFFNPYVPGQQQPPKPPSAKPEPFVPTQPQQPPQQPTPQRVVPMNDADWRRQFEEERMR